MHFSTFVILGSLVAVVASVPVNPSDEVFCSQCADVAAWSSNVAYTGGSQVTYNGQLWTASWWTESNAPGGGAGVWVDDGAC